MFRVSQGENYLHFLAEYERETLVMFFAESPSIGIRGAKYIGELEDFLIQVAVARNSGLMNVKGAKASSGGSQGSSAVVPGATSTSAQKFRRMMGL